MPRFTYDAFQQDGSSVSGSLEARDEIQALELISGRGLTPVDIKLGSARGPWWSREFSLTGASSVRAKDLEAFFWQLRYTIGSKTASAPRIGFL
jgi:general secretion pathway protein F